MVSEIQMSQTTTDSSSTLVRRSCCRGLAVLLFLTAIAVTAAFAQPEAEEALWVDLRDSRGRPIDDPAAAGLEVFEDGQAAEIVRIEAATPDRGGPGARVVLYFDAELSEAGTYRRGAEALGAAAESLVALGTVELVIADPEPHRVLETDDALALGERLGWLGASDRGRGAVRSVRTRALAALAREVATNPWTAAEQASEARAAAEEEAERVRTQARRLLGWIAESDPVVNASAPSILVLVSDGWDLRPFDYWRGQLDSEAVSYLNSGSDPADRLARTTGETSRALAAAGWTVWPLNVGTVGLEVDDSGEALDPAGEAGGLFPTVSRSPQLRFGGGKKEDEEAVVEAQLLEPGEPLRRLADASGGEQIASTSGLRDAAKRFADRARIVYRSRLTARDGVHSLELRTRPGVSVAGRRWASRATPDPILSARIEALLRGDEADHGFDVAAALTLLSSRVGDEGEDEETDEQAADPRGERAIERQGSLEARISLAALDEPIARTDLRVTVGRLRPDGELSLEHDVLDDEALGGQGEWRYQRAMAVSADGEELAILIEDLRSGRWGGALASVVYGDRVEVAVAASPRSSLIEILPPDDELLRGRIRFTARAPDPVVAAVAFELDDREIERVAKRPFSARLDLGRILRQQTLTAVALDAAGEEIDRHSVLLNAGNGALAVEIANPKEGPASGVVDVEALVTVPLEQALDQVLFYWNTDLLATQYQAPFRQRITIPDSRPMGYVRVVAMLEDGTLAEDVVFLNGPQAGDRVDVDLVELYAVVTDRDGRPVQGLEREDFEVRENGEVQEIADFSNAGDLPITLGLAIDSSASMFVKLPRVQTAATRFLGTVLSTEDRAFVVDFDNQPRLVRGTTGDLPRVVQAIDGLEASGRTALWESVVFSLVQLQGVRGRKALIVFSDGADEDDHFPYRSSLKLAKQMGVPIYMILMKRRPQKDRSGFSLWNRSFSHRAEKLVRAGGGRVYYGREYESFDEIYEEIGRELRSQYLLTYYPKPGSRATWREVDIKVRKPGLDSRTLSGYWPP